MAEKFEDQLGEKTNAFAAGARSALGGAARGDRGGLRVEDCGLCGVVLLRADFRHPDAAAPKALGPTPEVGKLASKEGLLLLRPDPQTLMALCGYDAAPALALAVKSEMAERPGAALVTTASDGFALLRLRGSGGREALAKGAAADLHPLGFGPGDVRALRLGGVEAVLFAEEGDDLENEAALQLLAPRSAGASIADWLAKAAPKAGEAPVFQEFPRKISEG